MTTEELNERRNERFINDPQGFIDEYSYDKDRINNGFDDNATFVPSWILKRCVAAMIIYYKKRIKKLEKKVERKDRVIDIHIPCLRALANENESLRNELLSQLKMQFDEEDAKEFAKEFMSDEVHEIAKQFRQPKDGEKD